jgi:hypothetical protein
MALPTYVNKVIESHKKVQEKFNMMKSLKHINVSKLASFAGSAYERFRNTIELEQDHLLRRRAIRRIMVRMGALRYGDPFENAEDLMKEIIWGKYTRKINIPEVKIAESAYIIKKYVDLLDAYQVKFGKRISHSYADDLYDLASVEIERSIFPYDNKDALINTQYFYLKPLNLVEDPNLNQKTSDIQNYIQVIRSVTKFDDAYIKFYMFANSFPFWFKEPTKADFSAVATRFEQTMDDIQAHLNYKIPKGKYKEFVRFSVPINIINKVIQNNVDDADGLLEDKVKRDEEIKITAKALYDKISKKLNGEIFKMVLYLAATKMIFALVLEVPYELAAYGHIKYLPLAINILFPPIFLFIVAKSFRIPQTANTAKIIEMIDRFLDPASTKYTSQAIFRTRKRPFLYFVFKMIYYSLFFVTIAFISTFLVMFLHYDAVGLAIFLLFLCLVSFAALRVRSSATEVVVIPIRDNIFSPLLDLVGTPIAAMGKRLGDGVAKFSPIPFVLDMLVESPFKAILWLVEEWNTYMREQKDEIV